MKRYKHALLPVRMNPPHIGHIDLIRKSLQTADKITLIIFAADEISPKNPFTGEERIEMIKNSLSFVEKIRCEFICMPVFKTSEEREKFIDENVKKFSKESLVISGSSPVIDIYKKRGNDTITPIELIGKNKIKTISGYKFRKLIEKTEKDWERFAAKGVIKYNKNGIVKERILKYPETKDDGKLRIKKN